MGNGGPKANEIHATTRFSIALNRIILNRTVPNSLVFNQTASKQQARDR
jgi:hypothetical protein